MYMSAENIINFPPRISGAATPVRGVISEGLSTTCVGADAMGPKGEGGASWSSGESTIAERLCHAAAVSTCRHLAVARRANPRALLAPAAVLASHEYWAQHAAGGWGGPDSGYATDHSARYITDTNKQRSPEPRALAVQPAARTAQVWGLTT